MAPIAHNGCYIYSAGRQPSIASKPQRERERERERGVHELIEYEVLCTSTSDTAILFENFVAEDSKIPVMYLEKPTYFVSPASQIRCTVHLTPQIVRRSLQSHINGIHQKVTLEHTFNDF